MLSSKSLFAVARTVSSHQLNAVKGRAFRFGRTSSSLSVGSTKSKDDQLLKKLKALIKEKFNITEGTIHLYLSIAGPKVIIYSHAFFSAPSLYKL